MISGMASGGYQGLEGLKGRAGLTTSMEGPYGAG